MRSRMIVVLCLALLAIGGFSLTGCTSAQVGSSNYSVGDAQTAFLVENGTVESVRTITLAGNTSTGTGIGVGALAGAAGGGLLGGLIGDSSRGVAIGAATGALVGGASGGLIASNTGDQPGFEITVLLDNGLRVAVVQGTDVQFFPGQRVQLITRDGTTRVAPIR